MNERQIGIEKMRNADHGDKSRADALTEAVTHTIETIKRQLDLIADRAPSNFLDKRSVVQSLTAHVRRLEKALAASPVEQPALLTAQDALAAIETFEIVGDNNDSREPNAEDRFILTEFVAHLFGGFRVEHPAAAPADGACKRCGSTTAQACNDVGCFYLESGDEEPSAAQADERAAHDESLRGEVAYQLQVRHRFLDMTTMRAIVDSAFDAAIAKRTLPGARAAASPAAVEMRDAAMRTVQAMGLVYTPGSDRWRPNLNHAPAAAAASPAAGAVKAWINYPVITNGGEFAGYGEPELSFKRLAYGYDTDRAVPLIAAPQPAQADAAAGATSVPYDGLTEEFTDEIARLANDAPGIREAVAGALESCGVIIAPAQADALHVSGHHPEYVKGFNDGKREFSNAFELGIHEGKRQADAPAEAREPIAWVTDDDRAITAAQKQRALADGGATASSVRPYSIPCYAVSAPANTTEAREPMANYVVPPVTLLEQQKRTIAERHFKGAPDVCRALQCIDDACAEMLASAPADAGEAVAHMRVRSTDAGSTSHAIDIAPEAAALDLKPGEYLLYLAPPTTRAAHLTTTLSPDQRISMAAKLFFLANELLNGADR